MNYEILLGEAVAFISKYMRKHDNAKLLYHNLFHTQNVVAIAGQIAKQSSLKEDELFIVSAAAWFLYVGWYKDASHAEEESAELAGTFFTTAGVADETIDSIKNCILSTMAASAPATVLANIICDADSFYFGTESFLAFNKLERKESELITNISIDKNEWNRNTILMLERHQYFTEYCKSRLNTTKQQNLEKLKQKNPLLSLTENSIAALFSDDARNSDFIEKYNGTEKEKDKESKANSADRTIETMFRTSSANSQRLSSQADTKAHIMISVNTIITSLILGVVSAKSNFHLRLNVPMIMLLVSSLITIIFSVLATRPNVAKRQFTENDFQQNKVNLLFFGNFFTMHFDEYKDVMQHIMSDKQSLYIVMLRNLYEQGQVLAKKYRLLKISYNVFMYGLVLSVIVFFIVSKFFNKGL
ncbi:MAG: Pycsar system effector family protein [Ginsengibacter sp.]